MQYFARPGDMVLKTTNDYSLLASYAARKANGALALLVINKHSSSNLNAQITVTNFFPWSTATVRSFGIAQDEATRTNGPAAAQDITTNLFVGASTNFMTAFPPYSLTLSPLPPQLRGCSPSPRPAANTFSNCKASPACHIRSRPRLISSHGLPIPPSPFPTRPGT